MAAWTAIEQQDRSDDHEDDLNDIFNTGEVFAWVDAELQCFSDEKKAQEDCDNPPQHMGKCVSRDFHICRLC